jgi:predicted RNA-binding Zn-ribbon protein involved in translation (DUF1610 family)
MKTLLFDIETKPNLAWVWEKYEQDVISFEKERELLSFAWKWLGEKKTHCLAECDFKTNKELVKKLWELFEEANVIIAHNGNRFDIKMSNGFFAYYGLTPPSPYKTVDTLMVARTHFKFNSNKLNDLGEYLGLGKKVETGGFKLWLGCIKGDKKSFRLMKKYNSQDVTLLEKVYIKLRPWMTRHPVMNNYENSCPICSGQGHSKGWRVTKTRKYQRYQCQKCGHYYSL